jgi:hypothetical protein
MDKILHDMKLFYNVDLYIQNINLCLTLIENKEIFGTMQL